VLGGKCSQLYDRVLSPDMSSRRPLNWRLGGPKSRSGRFGEEKTFCPCQEMSFDERSSCVQPYHIIIAIIMIIFA